MSKQRVDTGGVSSISHNALDRIIDTILPLFCQINQSCSQAWKGNNDDDLVRPVLESRFCSFSCFFLIVCYFKSPVEGDRWRSRLLCLVVRFQ